MGGVNGSSLNLNKKNYVIYSTDFDFKNIVEANLRDMDLILEKDANKRDGARPNKVTCKSRSTLRKLLEIYAKNNDYK